MRPSECTRIGHQATAMKSDRQSRIKASRLASRQVLVIGLGGIGVPVADALARFLAFGHASTTLFLIDGDTIEERNRSRVSFAGGGNKALAKAAELTSACESRLAIIPVPKYVTPGNAHRIIDDGSIVFLAVDNHATRRCISNRCRRLDQVLLISGGNDAVEDGRDGTFGNVIVFERNAGRDLHPPLTRYHPEIARPVDKRPDQAGCAALAQSAPQLLFTNLAVASTMLGVFYAWLVGRLEHDEVFLDIATAKMNPVARQR
jgi:hypothetical protein